MQAQLDAGRGAFLMGAHLGSFEVMASIGRRQPGLQVSMAMYEHNARKINAMLAAIGQRVKPDIIPLGQMDAMLRIADRLDHGAFVGVLGDRTLGEEPVHRVMLLGREAWLPTGPMRAAASWPNRFVWILEMSDPRCGCFWAPSAWCSSSHALT